MVRLPELEIAPFRVKIDTGARTSAIHAHDVKPIDIDGRKLVEFTLSCSASDTDRRHVLPVHAVRSVKNSGGEVRPRFSIVTVAVLGDHRWPIELTLADRTTMKYDMILGRRAMRDRKLLVDPGRSYLLGSPDDP